jgi:hypothetical protein
MPRYRDVLSQAARHSWNKVERVSGGGAGHLSDDGAGFTGETPLGWAPARGAAASHATSAKRQAASATARGRAMATG